VSNIATARPSADHFLLNTEGVLVAFSPRPSEGIADMPKDVGKIVNASLRTFNLVFTGSGSTATANGLVCTA
jgi:hypothetical protein